MSNYMTAAPGVFKSVDISDINYVVTDDALKIAMEPEQMKKAIENRVQEKITERLGSEVIVPLTWVHDPKQGMNICKPTMPVVRVAVSAPVLWDSAKSNPLADIQNAMRSMLVPAAEAQKQMESLKDKLRVKQAPEWMRAKLDEANKKEEPESPFRGPEEIPAILDEIQEFTKQDDCEHDGPRVMDYIAADHKYEVKCFDCGKLLDVKSA